VTHALLVNLSEFRALGLHVPEDRVYGCINVLGDVANRGLFGIIRKAFRHLGIAANQILVPQRAPDFLGEISRQIFALNVADAENAPTVSRIRLAPQAPVPC
jgi:hypothetical protein